MGHASLSAPTDQTIDDDRTNHRTIQLVVDFKLRPVQNIVLIVQTFIQVMELMQRLRDHSTITVKDDAAHVACAGIHGAESVCDP